MELLDGAGAKSMPALTIRVAHICLAHGLAAHPNEVQAHPEGEDNVGHRIRDSHDEILVHLEGGGWVKDVEVLNRMAGQVQAGW